MTQTTPGNTGNTPPPPAAPAPADIDVEGALKALAEMVDKGIVTPEEYAVKKAEWLRKYGH